MSSASLIVTCAGTAKPQHGASARSASNDLAIYTGLPYMPVVRVVIETNAFLAAAKQAGMAEEERGDLISLLASDPTTGDMMVGTGGCRKVRIKKPGTGKSGGYRVVTYFGGGDIPLILLTVFGKNERANLDRAERNALKALVSRLDAELRKSR